MCLPANVTVSVEPWLIVPRKEKFTAQAKARDLYVKDRLSLEEIHSSEPAKPSERSPRGTTSETGKTCERKAQRPISTV